MKTLIGGAIAATLGLIGIAVWHTAIMQLVAATIPPALLIGGGLALYLGFDELKDSWKQDKEASAVEESADADSKE